MYHKIIKFKRKDRSNLVRINKHYKCKFISDKNYFITGKRNEKII